MNAWRATKYSHSRFFCSVLCSSLFENYRPGKLELVDQLASKPLDLQLNLIEIKDKFFPYMRWKEPEKSPTPIIGYNIERRRNQIGRAHV